MLQHSQDNEKRKRVKFAKREAVLHKNLIPVVEQTLRESPSLEKFYVSRISLSREGGCVNIFVSKLDNQPLRREALEALKMYKAPIRKVVADILCSKWTPEVNIRFDQKLEKVRHTDQVMNEVLEREHNAEPVSLEQTIAELTKKLEAE